MKTISAVDNILVQIFKVFVWRKKKLILPIATCGSFSILKNQLYSRMLGKDYLNSSFMG
jgi:hypothetical protein